jgi:Fe-S cluster assembly iron-binding protein IscA
MVSDSACEGDLVWKTDGLDFVISPETYKISGDINIAYIDEPGKKGFSITSSKPVSEWEGFGICDIKI